MKNYRFRLADRSKDSFYFYHFVQAGSLLVALRSVESLYSTDMYMIISICVLNSDGVYEEL